MVAGYLHLTASGQALTQQRIASIFLKWALSPWSSADGVLRRGGTSTGELGNIPP